MPADPALLADDPDLAPLWQAVHARLCTGESADAMNIVRVPGMTRAGVAALRSWLDTTTRRRRGRSAVTVTADTAIVPLRELLTVLAVPPAALPDLVERALGTPVVNRSAAARVAAALREDLWTYAAQRLPQVPRLVARMRLAGVGADDTEIRRTVDAIAAVLPRLPARPRIPLAKLAHDTAGDPHFFDLDTTTAARLVAAIAEMTGRTEPTRPDLVRALLADVGVIADRLSATVLLLNVDAVGDGPIDRRLRDSTAPVALTLLDLTDTPPVLAPQTLTVVENPSVLEFALGAGVRIPMACTSGQLRAIDHVLLQLAVRCGLQLRYAGDLDRTGLQIADVIASSYGATLIAMDAATVQAAASEPSTVALQVPASAADGDAAAALNLHARAIFQEHDAVLRRIFGVDSTKRGGARKPTS